MFIEILKVIFLGIVEGITEWLPISSTGHMLLVDRFLHLNASDEFKEMFFIVIQIGAILAVILLFWDKMFPFRLKNRNLPFVRRDVFDIWFKVVVACVPGAVVTLLFDDWFEAHMKTPVVIALALIIYGVAFLVIEKRRRRPAIRRVRDIGYSTAFLIGMFQVLSIIPGTSRSGATILGALLIGVSRLAAAEFTFFMAVPVMFGYGFLKLIKFGFAFTFGEFVLMFFGMLSAFVVSLFVIRALMHYIRHHDFRVFGVYRIILGIIVLVYFALFA